MIVQIYEVGSASEARALAALGVDHVGVLVGPGEFPRELDVEQAAEVFAAVPRGAVRVALSLSEDPQAISAIVGALRPDVLHLGTTPEGLAPDEVRRIARRHPGVRIMRTVPVVDRSSLEVARAYRGIAHFLLLDTQDAGQPVIGATGRTHDWSISRRIVEQVPVPVVLAGGLGPHNVARAIREVGPAGVDSKTCTDRADGRGKDLARVAEFVRRARA